MGDSGNTISSEAEILARMKKVAGNWTHYRHTHIWPGVNYGEMPGSEEDCLEQDCKEVDGYMRQNKDNEKIILAGLQCFNDMPGKFTVPDYHFNATKDLLPLLIPNNPDLLYYPYCHYMEQERDRSTFEKDLVDSGFMQLLEWLKEKNPSTKYDEDDSVGYLLSRAIGFLENHPDNPHYSSLPLLKSMME